MTWRHCRESILGGTARKSSSILGWAVALRNAQPSQSGRTAMNLPTFLTELLAGQRWRIRCHRDSAISLPPGVGQYSTLYLLMADDGRQDGDHNIRQRDPDAQEGENLKPNPARRGTKSPLSATVDRNRRLLFGLAQLPLDLVLKKIELAESLQGADVLFRWRSRRQAVRRQSAQASRRCG